MLKRETKQSLAVVCKEYNFTMSGTEIQVISSNNSTIQIAGTTNFTLEGDLTGTNWVIPNLKEDLSGCLILNDDTPVIELRGDVPLEEAKRLVYEYISSNPGAKTSELVMELCLDPALVIEALNMLRNEEKIEGKDVQTK